MSLTWTRSVLTRMEGIYCVEVLHTWTGMKIAAASELHDGVCKVLDPVTGEEEVVWDGPGGCMNVAQLDEAGSLIGVQNFYKGAQALDAQMAEAVRGEQGWQVRVLAKLPYLHHCGVVSAAGETYAIASTLCTRRDYPGDWAHPGKIQVFPIPGPGEETDIQTIREDVVKNHGFWQGKLDGQEVTLISGNALYAVHTPKRKKQPWVVEILINREISDIAVADIDGDGVDEILAFEGLHGNQATINKRINGRWEVIYSCPMEFSHGIWGGKLLGKEMFAIGSMEGQKELALLYSVPGKNGIHIERKVLETGIGPSNLRGATIRGRDAVLVAAREAGELVLFEFD